MSEIDHCRLRGEPMSKQFDNKEGGYPMTSCISHFISHHLSKESFDVNRCCLDSKKEHLLHHRLREGRNHGLASIIRSVCALKESPSQQLLVWRASGFTEYLADAIGHQETPVTTNTEGQARSDN
ncbi:MAG TPA: hypothetical protein DCR61_09895 [Verrucomicrobiales bacterium]|nr:hypothetical protein [Verrucomicrobiales bacterium]